MRPALTFKAASSKIDKLMKKYWIFYAIINIVLFSCNQNRFSQEGLMQNTTSHDYELVSTEKILSYELDDETKYQFELFTYTDKSGKEYLTFLNSFHQILFYDLNKEDFLFKIQTEREGPNGIPGPGGFFIEDFDNIYVTCQMTPFLYKINTTGTLIQKIRYGITDSGYSIIPYRSASFYYSPLVFIDSKLYLPQRPWTGNSSFTTPLCVVIDTVNQLQYELSYPFPLLQRKNESISGTAVAFSRVFNGKEFVYSFFFDENIHIATIDHQEVRKYT